MQNLQILLFLTAYSFLKVVTVSIPSNVSVGERNGSFDVCVTMQAQANPLLLVQINISTADGTGIGYTWSFS